MYSVVLNTFLRFHHISQISSHFVYHRFQNIFSFLIYSPFSISVQILVRESHIKYICTLDRALAAQCFEVRAYSASKASQRVYCRFTLNAPQARLRPLARPYRAVVDGCLLRPWLRAMRQASPLDPTNDCGWNLSLIGDS